MPTSANDNPTGVTPGSRSPTRTALSGGSSPRKQSRKGRKSGRS